MDHAVVRDQPPVHQPGDSLQGHRVWGVSSDLDDVIGSTVAMLKMCGDPLT